MASIRSLFIMIEGLFMALGDPFSIIIGVAYLIESLRVTLTGGQRIPFEGFRWVFLVSIGSVVIVAQFYLSFQMPL